MHIDNFSLPLIDHQKIFADPKKVSAATGFEPASPYAGVEHPLAAKASTLSIRSHGALPMSYTAIKEMQPNPDHGSKFIAT